MERYREKYLSSKYIDVRSDWGFKHLMRVKKILKMLLGDVLNEKIVSMELTTKVSSPRSSKAYTHK